MTKLLCICLINTYTNASEFKQSHKIKQNLKKSLYFTSNNTFLKDMVWSMVRSSFEHLRRLGHTASDRLRRAWKRRLFSCYQMGPTTLAAKRPDRLRSAANACDLQRSFRQQVEFFRKTLAKSAAG